VRHLYAVRVPADIFIAEPLNAAQTDQWRCVFIYICEIHEGGCWSLRFAGSLTAAEAMNTGGNKWLPATALHEQL